MIAISPHQANSLSPLLDSGYLNFPQESPRYMFPPPSPPRSVGYLHAIAQPDEPSIIHGQYGQFNEYAIQIQSEAHSPHTDTYPQVPYNNSEIAWQTFPSQGVSAQMPFQEQYPQSHPNLASPLSIVSCQWPGSPSQFSVIPDNNANVEENHFHHTPVQSSPCTSSHSSFEPQSRRGSHSSLNHALMPNSPHTSPQSSRSLDLYITTPNTPSLPGSHGSEYPSSPSYAYAAQLTPPPTAPGYIHDAQSSHDNTSAQDGHREQIRLFREAMLLPMESMAGPFIPQKIYVPHTNSDRRRYVEEIKLQQPIYFWVQEPSECGIPLIEALHSRVRRLLYREDPVFEGRGPSISVRIQWPGYRPWSRQIPTKDFRSPPGPITRAKLAKNVAKCVERFLTQAKRQHPMEDDVDRRWKIGVLPNEIKLEDLVLVSMHHVSMGSWQPQLRLRRPFLS